jgi:hypothetical protein
MAINANIVEKRGHESLLSPHSEVEKGCAWRMSCTVVIIIYDNEYKYRREAWT